MKDGMIQKTEMVTRRFPESHGGFRDEGLVDCRLRAVLLTGGQEQEA